jgi:plastocyanin
MRFRARWLGVVPLVVLGAVLVGGQATSAGVSAQGRRTVTIHDNNAPSPAPPQNLFAPAQGRWQFNPTNLEVRRGEPIVFQSPPGNTHEHTVTSLVRVGSPFAVPVQLQGGTLFDSPLIQPGESFTLSTAPLAPGNYAYICKLHIWMNGEFTVS